MKTVIDHLTVEFTVATAIFEDNSCKRTEGGTDYENPPTRLTTDNSPYATGQRYSLK
jgi:hypothetical protein